MLACVVCMRSVCVWCRGQRQRGPRAEPREHETAPRTRARASCCAVLRCRLQCDGHCLRLHAIPCAHRITHNHAWPCVFHHLPSSARARCKVYKLGLWKANGKCDVTHTKTSDAERNDETRHESRDATRRECPTLCTVLLRVRPLAFGKRFDV